MDDERNRSCEALKGTEGENLKVADEGEGGIRDAEMEESDDRRRTFDGNRGGCAAKNSSGGAAESETLASLHLSDGDSKADYDECPNNLSEVPVKYSLQSLQSSEELKDQERAEHDQTEVGINDQSAQVQIQLPDGPSKLEASPTSVAQSISSTPPSQTPLEENCQPVENKNNICHTEQNKQNAPDQKHPSSVPVVKAPSDGYNWRKYGQKQVKSPEGFRSYYRCTFSDCYAKKIEFCDRSNYLIETVYRSHHNHNPPQKTNFTRENRSLLPILPVKSDDTSSLEKDVNNQVPSVPKEPVHGVGEITGTKQPESSGSDETTELNMKGSIDEPEGQERKKRKYTGEMESGSKAGKKPKYIVHAAGDVGISGDGYRWRKYGQKMVKNNPHPRNYYRCTSAGCPVRKHIERAVDNASAVVIAYKGIHDHSAPVPRKCPNDTLASASLDSLQNKTKQLKSETQWSVDKEGKLTGEAFIASTEKAPEPAARTLLSIGFEIKPRYKATKRCAFPNPN